jgi:hypothetical protein
VVGLDGGDRRVDGIEALAGGGVDGLDGCAAERAALTAEEGLSGKRHACFEISATSLQVEGGVVGRRKLKSACGWRLPEPLHSIRFFRKRLVVADVDSVMNEVR